MTSSGKLVVINGSCLPIGKAIALWASENEAVTAMTEHRPQQSITLIGSWPELEFADLGDHRLKGFERPIQVWRVLAPGSASSCFEARTSVELTPLIARQAELRLLPKQYGKAKRGKAR